MARGWRWYCYVGLSGMKMACNWGFCVKIMSFPSRNLYRSLYGWNYTMTEICFKLHQQSKRGGDVQTKGTATRSSLKLGGRYAAVSMQFSLLLRRASVYTQKEVKTQRREETSNSPGKHRSPRCSFTQQPSCVSTEDGHNPHPVWVSESKGLGTQRGLQQVGDKPANSRTSLPICGNFYTNKREILATHTE